MSIFDLSFIMGLVAATGAFAVALAGLFMRRLTVFAGGIIGLMLAWVLAAKSAPSLTTLIS